MHGAETDTRVVCIWQRLRRRVVALSRDRWIEFQNAIIADAGGMPDIVEECRLYFTRITSKC